MAERSCGVPEERWVDLLGGGLSVRESKALLAHKDGCTACRMVFEQWQALLGDTGSEWSEAGLREREQFVAIGRRAAPGEEHGEWSKQRLRETEPAATHPGRAVAQADLSPALRRSLRRRAAAYALARRSAAAIRTVAKRPAVAAACGLGAAVAVLLLLLNPFARSGTSAGGSLSPAGYAMLHEPGGAAVMSEPDTIVYRSGGASADGALDPGLPPGARETLWLNVRTHELFLLMEGLLPSDRTDVQAWSRSGGKNANLGLLRFNDTRAHLYSANVRPEEWESVLLTIEPKGGSPIPTKPETASIRLKPASVRPTVTPGD